MSRFIVHNLPVRVSWCDCERFVWQHCLSISPANPFWGVFDSCRGRWKWWNCTHNARSPEKNFICQKLQSRYPFKYRYWDPCRFVIHLRYKFYPYHTDTEIPSCTDTNTASVSVLLTVLVRLPRLPLYGNRVSKLQCITQISHFRHMNQKKTIPYEF